MKIAIAQIEIEAVNLEVNANKILTFIEQSRTQNADLIIFPNAAVSGYFLGDIWRQDSFRRECDYFNRQIIEASTDIAVIFGSVDAEGNNIIFAAQNGKPLEVSNHIDVEIGGKIYHIGGENADFVVQIDNSPYAVGKRHTSNASCPLIYVNAVGLQNTGKTVYTFDGGSAIYNSFGEIVLRGEPYGEFLSVIDFDEIDKLPKIDVVDEREIVGIYRAVSYGVKKFLQQIRVGKVVIGISGGIDSAVAAALYTKVLGAENVYLVNMPSVFNSATTKGLSKQLAKNLGCKYVVKSIQKSVNWTVKQLESGAFKFLSDDSEEQLEITSFVRENIQARDRSSRILAAVAASIGGVFTCNANKAETTVGYATLYGDEAGFLSALADLWKFQVYELAHYLNDEVYKREVIPQGIIDIVPSAELSSAQNVDEGKGDPLKYPYHDYLFRAFVERISTPEDILNWYVADTLETEIGCEAGLVNKYFPTAEEFIADLERWWKLFTGIAVAKRIQSPPILAVSSRAYGGFNESQYNPHFTREYNNLKAKLLMK